MPENTIEQKKFTISENVLNLLLEQVDAKKPHNKDLILSVVQNDVKLIESELKEDANEGV